MAEEYCTNRGCGHPRRSHNKNGCGDIKDWKTGEGCKCKVKYMDKHKFKAM